METTKETIESACEFVARKEPWRVFEPASCKIVAGDYTVAQAAMPAIATRIVRAVNAHGALVAACKLALGQLDGVKALSGVHASSLRADIEIIRAALALAQGGAK